MRLSAVLCSSALVCTSLLTGCTLQTTAPNSLAQGGVIQGRVHGGRQPITGAHIYLMAANTTGYGNAAVSLLDPTITHLSDTVGAYVLTDAQGGFSITGDYSCSANQQVYLLAVGGNPGAGVNPASALMAVLGQCPSNSTNFLAADPFISVNEATTVAGVYALSGYMTDMLHVSSSGTALANTGMANAFLTAANLADISTGSALATTPAGNGTVPQAKINTIANILAACINSDGTVASSPVPTSCYTLFSNATSDGTSSGTIPAETVTAALNIAHNQGVNVASLYALQTASAPFLPNASSVSNFLVGISFTGGGIVLPVGIAIDGKGDVWTINYPGVRNGVSVGNSASKLAAGAGAALSPAVTGYTADGVTIPRSIAIDNSNNVWIGGYLGTSGSNGYIAKLAEDGTPVSSPVYVIPSMGSIVSLAIDSHGNAITARNGTGYKVDGITGALTQLAGSPNASSFTMAIAPGDKIWIGTGTFTPGLEELNANGTLLFPTTTNPSLSGTTGGLQNPVAIAIDHAGNIWAANGGTINGLQYFGVAEFSSSGVLLSPATNSSNFAGDDQTGEPTGIAIDGAGKVFVAHLTNTFAVLDTAGSTISPPFGYTDSSLNGPSGVAVDGSGNVWIPNALGDSVTEFVGVATPVVTPIAAGVANNTLGTRP